MRAFRTLRSVRGASIVEISVATLCLTGLLAVAVPAFHTVGNAGGEGQSRSWTDADNRQALLRISRELVNSSLVVDADGNPEFLTISAGSTPIPLAEAVRGGTAADSLARSGGAAAAALSQSGGARDEDDCDEDEDEDEDEDARRGNRGESSGHDAVLNAASHVNRGASGRMRVSAQASVASAASASVDVALGGGAAAAAADPAVVAAAAVVGDPALRPRNRDISRNSVLTFRRVTGYAVGVEGDVTLTWSTPITYRVPDGTRTLVREQDGRSRVVSPSCSGFLAEVVEGGTVAVTLLTEKRANSTQIVVSQCNQVEVRPKN